MPPKNATLEAITSVPVMAVLKHQIKQPRSIISLILLASGSVLLSWKQRQLNYLEKKRMADMDAKKPNSNEKQNTNDKQKTDKNTKRDGKIRVDGVFLRRLIEIFRIIVPSVKSREFLYLGGLSLLLVLRTYLSVIITRQLGKNGQFLVTRQYKQLLLGVLSFGIITIPASAINSGLKYIQSMMALRFRMRLSEHVHKSYLDGVNFYRACSLGKNRIDHADQRVTSDIDAFCTNIAELYATIFKPVLDMILFTYKLVGITSWQGPVIMYTYFLLSGLAKNTLIPSLGKYVARESELEGAYRTQHKSLLVNSEEIAFYDGAETEKQIINQHLDQVSKHSELFTFVRALVSVADNLLVKYWASLAGYATMIGPMMYNLKGLGTKSVDELTRDYILTSQYLGQLSNAVGEMVILSSKVMKIAGYTHRVSELLEMVRKLESSGIEAFEERSELNDYNTSSFTDSIQEEISTDGQKAVLIKYKSWLAEWKKRRDVERSGYQEPNQEKNERIVHGGGVIKRGEIVEFDHVDIVSPEGKILAKDLSCKINHSLMISGPNGAGKSSIFRVIAELWPLHNGRMTKPDKKEIVFIPQKPYTSYGTLRDQIIYPHSVDQMKARGITDEDLKILLEIVDPSQTILSEWDFDTRKNWNQAMSMGQMQRIAASRLFYHAPLYAVLDECTSCVSGSTEDVIYETCHQLGIIVCSVSHRPSLIKHHKYQLHLDGKSGWSFKEIDATDAEFLCK